MWIGSAVVSETSAPKIIPEFPEGETVIPESWFAPETDLCAFVVPFAAFKLRTSVIETRLISCKGELSIREWG